MRWSLWRMRWGVVPIASLLGMLFLGWLLTGAKSAIVFSVVALLALVWLVRRNDRDPIKPGLQKTVPWQITLPVIGAPAWLATTCVIGFGRLALVLFLVAWLPWAVAWWRKYEIRANSQFGGPLGQVWAERSFRKLAGTVLVGEKVIRNRFGAKIGREAEIVSTDGQNTTAEMVAATENVAAWFGADPVNITIEPTKSRKGDRARFLMFDKNPLLGVQHWKGPDLTGGAITLGPYADSTMCRYRYFAPGWGPWHDLIAGTTGAGKSGLLNILFASSRHGLVDGQAGCFVDWFCDPQYGQSAPDWVDNVDWCARGVEEGLEMLRATERVMLARNRYLSDIEWVDAQGRKRKGKKSFDPSPEMPLLTVTIEEAAALFQAYPEAVEIAARIGKMARKCGIKLRLIVQVPLLTELGNNSTLRSMVASGNVICYRTADRLSANVAFNGALGVDPYRIPREIDEMTTAGMGYSLGVEARPMIFRTWLPEDVYHWATNGRTWTLDTLSATAAGDIYLNRHLVIDVQVTDLDGDRPALTSVPAGPSSPLATKLTTKDVVAAVLQRSGSPMDSGAVWSAVMKTEGTHGTTDRNVRTALKALATEGLISVSGAVPNTRYQWKADR